MFNFLLRTSELALAARRSGTLLEFIARSNPFLKCGAALVSFLGVPSGATNKVPLLLEYLVEVFEVKFTHKNGEVLTRPLRKIFLEGDGVKLVEIVEIESTGIGDSIVQL